MDIKTLYLCNGLVCFFLAGVSLFYRLTQKTYSGFDQWIAGSFLLAAAFGSIFLRLVGPEWVSVVMVHLAMMFGLVFRVDGLSRFCRNVKIPPAVYFFPLAYVGGMGWFQFFPENLALRTLAMTVAASCFFLWKVKILLNSNLSVGRPLCRLLAASELFFVGIFLFRGVYWMAHPETKLFEASFFHLGFHITSMIVDMIVHIGFLMLNGSRLEEDLIQSNTRLTKTLNDLQEAMSQIKVLSGILPICCYCKKIRDTKTQQWHGLESYIQSRTDADFSHGICPECFKKHAPGKN